MAGARRAIEQRVVAGADLFQRGHILAHIDAAPGVEQRIDARFQITQHLHDLVGALAGNVLKRAGGVNVDGFRVEKVAGGRVNARLAQCEADLLHGLGGGENVACRPLGG